jgi:hypothetical protein
MLGTVVLVIVILMVVAAIPAWPYSRNWGYRPIGALGLMVLLLIFLMITDKI